MYKFSEIAITNIYDAVTVCAERGKHLKICERKYYGLSFCLSGKITYTHNGKKIISDKNSAVILPQNATYELYNNEAGEFPLINFYCADDKFTEEFITIPINRVQSYIKDYERLKGLLLSPTNRLKAISVLYDIFDRLYTEEKNRTGILTPVLEYINENFCNADISNSSIAEFVNISEIYLRRLFKEKYLTTPKQYIIDMRIKLAKGLLTETQKGIDNIALECGFSSLYHFSRAFKEKTGLNPTEYRKIYGMGKI